MTPDLKINCLGIDTGAGGGYTFNVHGELYSIPFKNARVCSVILQGQPFDHVLLEKVSSSGNQGVKSAFTFGRNYGQWEGVLETLGHNVRHTLPAEWIRWFKMSIGAQAMGNHFEEAYPVRPPEMKRDKWYSEIKHYNQRIAQGRHPELKVTLKTADSVLIWQFAHYIAQKEK